MKADRYCFDGSTPCDLHKLPCDAKRDGVEKAQILEKTAANLAEMAALQDALYADGREGLVFILQALDAAGKDSTIKHVMSGLNPQGVRVTSFKQPNSEELSHDFLWRIHKALPPRGSIAIFNRSYYEDVLVVQVHDLQKGYKMPPRTLKGGKEAFFQNRYAQIRHYEDYLYDNGYRVVKIFLHLSKKEQKKRFLERIDNPAKNWKFSRSDLAERAHFDEYMHLFEEVIDATATKQSPWYAIPVDQKWYTRYLVSEVVIDALRRCCHEYPKLPEGALDELKDCRTRLEAED